MKFSKPLTLEEIRAAQHDDVTLTSDHGQWAFLTSCKPGTVRRDLTANATPIERRMIRRNKEHR